MCGIAGLVDRRLSQAELEQAARKMATALAHRGPDAEGLWCQAVNGVALAHRRLAIVELSEAGAQPMVSADGRWVLSYNGELYDAHAARSGLEALGYPFRGASDTEVLLALIASHGVAGALMHVEGIFAFAAYDRGEDRLWLARDRLGVKPLFYEATATNLVFASQLSALHAHRGDRREIDPHAVASLMRHGYVPARGAIWRGVCKLGAGEILSWRCGEAPKIATYWSLDSVIAEGRAKRFRGNAVDAADRLETLLAASVRRQMMSDVPLGAFLSGGVDSSTVVALMCASGGQARTYAVGFPEYPLNDESAPAAAVAAHLGTDHTTIPVGEAEALALVQRLPMIFDEPLADPSGLPTHLLCAATRAAGITVALSGDGGDELFGGYERYALATRFARRVEPLPQSLRRLAGSALGLLPSRATAFAARYLPPPWNGPDAADRVRKAAAQLPGSGFELYQRLLTLNPSARALALGVDDLPTPMDEREPDLSLLDRMRRLDSLAYLPDDVLAKVDRSSMAVGLEVRVPLLDREVVEFAWTLPQELLVSDAGAKLPLRTVLFRHVPRPLIERRKQGFAPPLAAWLRGPLRDYARDLLDNTEAGGGFLDLIEVRRMLDEHISGTRNHAVGLWPVITFEAWRRAWA